MAKAFASTTTVRLPAVSGKRDLGFTSTNLYSGKIMLINVLEVGKDDFHGCIAGNMSRNMEKEMNPDAWTQLLSTLSNYYTQSFDRVLTAGTKLNIYVENFLMDDEYFSFDGAMGQFANFTKTLCQDACPQYFIIYLREPRLLK